METADIVAIVTFFVTFVLGIILGGIVGLVNHYLLVIYFFVLALYFLLALLFSMKSSRSITQIGYQLCTYFLIHWNYGWGYLVGLYKLLMNRDFSVKVNR